MKRLTTTIAIVLLALAARAGTIHPPDNLVAFVPQGPVTVQVLRICLSWTDCSRNEISFRVERAIYEEALEDFGDWETVAVLERNTVRWADYTPPWGVWVAYQVVAVARNTESASNVAYYKLQ